MSAPASCHPPGIHNPASLREALAARSRTPIDPRTGLATDILNHFNETLMTLEVLWDDDCAIEDIRALQITTYEDHFQKSGLADAPLVIAAYHVAPFALRYAVDRHVEQLSLFTRACVLVLLAARDSGGQEGLTPAVNALCHAMRTEINTLDSLIHGQLGQDLAAQENSQGDIDALFA